MRAWSSIQSASKGTTDSKREKSPANSAVATVNAQVSKLAQVSASAAMPAPPVGSCALKLKTMGYVMANLAKIEWRRGISYSVHIVPRYLGVWYQSTDYFEDENENLDVRGVWFDLR